MSVLVYGIAERSDARIDGAGLEQQPLRGVCDGELVAVVSDHADAPGRTVENFWEYEQAVERTAHERPIAPARFGGVLDDDEAVLRLLDDKREQLAAVLDKTRGAVELALRATWDQPPEPKSHTGVSYLQARLEPRRRARQIAAELKPLGELARDSRSELPAGPHEPLRCAYLVARDQIQAFTALLERVDQQLPGVDLVCTGPWPPYSFAEEVAE